MSATSPKTSHANPYDCYPKSSLSALPRRRSPRKKLSISNEAFLDLGGAVARMGIPVLEILDEHETLIVSVNGIAERFREVFQRHF